MKTPNYEYLSALMDEEITSHKECEAAITDLLDHADAQRVWYEYHLIRDCLQNHQTELGYDINASLQTRLHKEGRLRLLRRSYFPANQAFKGFAVAAGVAAVAVAIWQMIPSDGMPIANHTAESIQAPLVLNFANVSPPTQSVAADSNNMTVALDNPYLQAHQRAMTTDGLMRVSASFDGAQ